MATYRVQVTFTMVEEEPGEEHAITERVTDDLYGSSIGGYADLFEVSACEVKDDDDIDEQIRDDLDEQIRDEQIRNDNSRIRDSLPEPREYF